VSAVNPRRDARTDREVMRGIRRRFDRLENPNTVRVGPWVLSVDADGELIATAPGRVVALTRQLAAANTAAGKPAGLHRTYVVTITGDPDGGVFQLRFAGSLTEPLDYDATAGEVLAALVGLSSRYSAIDFDVQGSAGGPWTVTVPDFGPISTVWSGLTGGTMPAITVE
jgi:hypothetical protein